MSLDGVVRSAKGGRAAKKKISSKSLCWLCWDRTNVPGHTFVPHAAALETESKAQRQEGSGGLQWHKEGLASL